MAPKTDEELLIQSDVIRDETAAGGNTRGRVADMLDDLIYSKANKSVTDDLQDQIDTLPTGGGGSVILTYSTHAGDYTLTSSELAVITGGNDLMMIGDATGDLTIPNNSGVAFEIGSTIGVRGYDNIIEGSGVTVTGDSGSLAIPTGSTATLEKTGTDTWLLHNGLSGVDFADIGGDPTDNAALVAYVESEVAGAGGATNLAATLSSSQVVITSDTGTDATIPAVDGTNAGVMIPTQKSKLDGIASGATANSSDATLLARANHTGTQLASTISNFDAAALAAAPAETTTTAGALINGATAKTTPVDADFVGLMDSAASNVLKKLSWANIKATLKTYFDTLYQAVGSYASLAGTETLTNKRITPRIQTVVSSATVTPSWDNDDAVKITAQAAGLTLANPSGTPTGMQGIVIRIKDNGVARAIGYGTQYRAVGISLPTTTVVGKQIYIGGVWNADDSKVDVLFYNLEV